MMIEEIMHFGMKSGDPSIGFLMMLSFFKDDYPWLYEIGLETYRGFKSAKTLSERKKLILNFERTFEMLGHPMIMEFSGKNEDMYIFNKELRNSMHHFFNRFLNDEKLNE
jgi:hypothetical protein